MSDQIPLHEHFKRIREQAQQQELTIQDILSSLGAESHYTMVAFLIIPFLQPVPLLGLSSILGPLIAIVAAFSYTNKPPPIPRSWAQRKVPSATVIKISENAEKLLKKFNKLVHTRWPFLLGEPFYTLSIALTVVNAILLALPLPIPFTNTLPAYAIFFWALSQLEDDGLFAALSYVATALCFAYFTLLAMGIDVGVTQLFS